MHTCKTNNLTVSYAGLPAQVHELGNFDLQKKRFTGHYKWWALDNFFLKRKGETQEELLKYCTFRKFDENGRLLPNGTWTGAIGDVVAQKSDATLNYQNQYIEVGLVDLSNIISSENLLVGHYIDEKPKTSPVINFEAIQRILAPSAWFLSEYVSVFVFSFALVYLLGRFLEKKPSLAPRFAYNLFAKTDPFFKRCSAVGLFFVANLLFLFIVQQILSNNVNTEKVIVSDDPILDTLEKISRTKKELCWLFKKGIDYFVIHLFGNLKKNSIERFIYEKVTSQKKPCFLLELANSIQDVSGKDFLILHSKVFMVFLKMFNAIIKKDIFIGDKPFYSTLVVHYLSKSINRRTKTEFNRQALIYFEGGYLQKSLREMDQIADQQFPPIKKTFRNAGEFVKHYTSVSNVEMKSFTFVYLFYTAWSVMLLAFALDKLTRILPNRMRLLRPRNRPITRPKLSP